MYDFLISEYIKKMNINDIINYGQKNNINISFNDANTLLEYAKKHYKTFMYDDPTPLLKELKKKLEPNTYKEAYRLYIINKNKYMR